jgi:hypothetical protein
MATVPSFGAVTKMLAREHLKHIERRLQCRRVA